MREREAETILRVREAQTGRRQYGVIRSRLEGVHTKRIRR